MGRLKHLIFALHLHNNLVHLKSLYTSLLIQFIVRFTKFHKSSLLRYYFEMLCFLKILIIIHISHKGI